MKLLIAGGGTGGHLFVGVAIAKEFLSRSSDNDILFVGTLKGLESKIIPKLNYKIEYIDVGGIKRVGIKNKIISLIKLPLSLIQSFKIIRKFKPDVVFGIGGYASGPLVLASSILKIPNAIQEQNSIPGITNRILGYITSTIFTAFESANKFFPSKKVKLVGNPVREEILEVSKNIERKSKSNITLFIFGGSQGSHKINQSMIEALPYLEPIKDKISIIHQTGNNDFQYVQEEYLKNKYNAKVFQFIDNMAEVYKESDIIICRGGALSIAEITVTGKASIIIPYPFAVYNHQEINAKELVEKEACEMILDKELDGIVLSKKIIELVKNPQKLYKMAANAKLLAQPNACHDIVEQLISLSIVGG